MFFLMELCILMRVVAYNFIFVRPGSLSAYMFGVEHYLYIYKYRIWCYASLIGCIFQTRLHGYKATTIIKTLRE